MKKEIKKILVSTLLTIPMTLCGCANPFGSNNSIGSSDSQNQNAGSQITTPSTGGGGGGGGSSQPTPEATPEVKTLYNPYDYEESGGNPYSEISKAMGYVKSVYKSGASSSVNTSMYEEYASTLLERLVSEYGLGSATLNPLSNVSSSTFSSLGLLKSGYTADNETIDTVVEDFMNAKFIESYLVSGMKYMILSPSTITTSDNLPTLVYKQNADKSLSYIVLGSNVAGLESVFLKSGTPETFPSSSVGSTPTDIELAATHNFSESVGFYKVTLNTGKKVYLIYNSAFVDNFGSNYDKIVDTHRDGIRFNKVSLESSSTSTKTVYNLTVKGWKIYESSKFTFTKTAKDPLTYPTYELRLAQDQQAYLTVVKDQYKKRVAMEMASVMAFGLTDSKELNLPTSPVGAAYNGSVDEFYAAAVANSSLYSSYMAFCTKYIEHQGFLAYEADCIAEYLANVIIGKDVLALDNANFTSPILAATGIEKTFNSNEKVSVNGTTVVRKLISDYNNKTTRAFGLKKNKYFQAINYSTTVVDSNSASDVLNYESSKYDERKVLFKNYINTLYSAGYELLTDLNSSVSLSYCDIDYDYLQNITIIEESAEDEEEDGGDEGEEEEENYITDTEIGGKVQSLILFPKKAVDIRYFEINLEAILAEGDSLAIEVDLRYHIGGKVYYVEDAMTADGGEAGVVTSEENTINFEYCSGLTIGANGLVFRDKNNQLLGEQLLTFNNTVGNNTPELRKKKFLFMDQVGKKTASDFKFNEFTSGMGANYCYNVYDYDFIEICFNVKPNYANFDTNYRISAKITSVYGQVK